ncbi:MAG TPA: hypothetical protein VKB00_06805 [Candidatus Limnocylindrales bacterium]|nr:hypothetical protein [Candidatus Limnocylindrales bacterium]
MPNRACPIILLLALLVAAGCGNDSDSVTASAETIELPGLSGSTNFDDIVYSPKLDRVLVPALSAGLFLIDPKTAAVDRIEGFDTADSVSEDNGLVYVADRSAQEIAVVDPHSGEVLSRAPTQAPVDYVRFIPGTRELWVTQPSASGIEVMELGRDPREPPRSVDFIPVEGGPEALTVESAGSRAYTHSFAGELVVLNVGSRSEVDRWSMGCDGAHGFPAIDERDRLLLASCDDDGEVVLFAADSGEELGRYSVGGGTTLPGYSRVADRFYVRSDPGDALEVLEASEEGLTPVGQVNVPPDGHCLTADESGHIWTCDTMGGSILRIDDR